MIFRALVLNGEKPIGGSMSSAESTMYLDNLNAMLESWSIERLLVYQTLQESFSLTSGTGTYTIGAGAALSTTARPIKIVDPCFIRDSGNLDNPLQIIDNTAWGRVVQKGAGVSYPSYINYDGSFDSSGFGTINLYPEPGASLTLFINSYKPLQNFAAISTSTSLPPGYQRAIEFNLAVELAGGFKPVSKEVAMIAMQSKAALKTLNTPDAMMRLDYAVVGDNIITGG